MEFVKIGEQNISEYEDHMNPDVAENMSRMYYRGIAGINPWDSNLEALLIWELHMIDEQESSASEIKWIYAVDPSMVRELMEGYQDEVEFDEVCRTFFESSTLDEGMKEAFRKNGFRITDAESTNLRVTVNDFASLILLFYIVASYVVLFRERERNRIPNYIKLTPTVACILIGLFLQYLYFFKATAVGFAVGLVFAWYYMFRRFSWMDDETGFYNKKYLPVFKKSAKERQMLEGTVIRFYTETDRKRLSEILHYWEPENSRIVAMDNGSFLVLTDMQKKFVVERFIWLIEDQCSSEGMDVKTSYEFQERIAELHFCKGVS